MSLRHRGVWLLPSAFNHSESEASQVQKKREKKKKVRSHNCLCFSETKSDIMNKRSLLLLLIIMMRNFQQENDEFAAFSTDPGSGFVSGGRQEQGGGCSFQVWQGDRHVSVD